MQSPYVIKSWYKFIFLFWNNFLSETYHIYVIASNTFTRK